MKKLLLLLGLLLVPHRSHAQGALGTVTDNGTVTCTNVIGNNASITGTCYKVTVACPGVASQSNIIIKVVPPTTGNLHTTITTISGLGGGGLYEFNWGSTGAGIITTLAADGYTVAETDWPLAAYGNSGWLAGPGGTKALACRPTSILSFINTTLATNTYACATGTSGGAAALGYALNYYEYNGLNFALLTSGPPLAEYGIGCSNSVPSGAFNPSTGTTTGQGYSQTAYSYNSGTGKLTFTGTECLDSPTDSICLAGNTVGVLSGFTNATYASLLNGQTVTALNAGLQDTSFVIAGPAGFTTNTGTIIDSGTFTQVSTPTYIDLDAEDVVDIGYSYTTTNPSPDFCEYALANNSAEFNSVLNYDSVDGTPFFTNSTPIYFIFGAYDNSNAPVNAYYYLQKIGATTPTTNYESIAATGHEIGETSAGATAIENALTTSCP